MALLCPHCRSMVQSAQTFPGGDVTCSSCGSSFRVESTDASPPTETYSSPLHGRKIGRFELLETLGMGGYGTVYKARDPELERTVALKVPRPDRLAGPSDINLFLREARSAAQLRHAGIVSVHEVGEWRPADSSVVVPYIVSELVEGITLADLLTARRPSFRESAELMAQAAEALQYAHDHGVVHRDVKPANIMLDAHGCPPGTMGALKLMDFGLAKRDAAEMTVTLDGQVFGTPAFMSPEQARGESHHVDGRTDVYSLGVILYQLLTGERPFCGNKQMLIYQVLQEEPRPPRRLNDRIPHDLQTICLKCMHKEPRRRYQTAGELAADLRRWLRDEPILARPAGRLERAWRWCRRKPAVAALTAATVLLLITGTVVSAGLAIWALREKGRADEKALEAKGHAAAALAEKERAEANFQRAERAVEKYLDGVGANPRLKEADFFDLRKGLLTSAVEFYEEFVKQKSDDPLLEAKRGKAYHRLGFINQELDQREEAVRQYRHMQGIFAALAARYADESAHRQSLAHSHSNLGMLLRQLGRRTGADSAEEHTRKALELQHHLVGEFPEVPDYRFELARGHYNLGFLQNELGVRTGPDSAEEHFRKAIVFQQQLVEEDPGAPTYRLELARTHNKLAVLLRDLDRRTGPDSALEHYRHALDHHQELVGQFARVPAYRQELARTHNNLAILLRDVGQRSGPGSAAEHFRQALDQHRRLVTDFPQVPTHRLELAQTHTNLANLLRDLGQRRGPDAAEEHQQKALTQMQKLVEEFPKVADYRSALGGTLHNFAKLLGLLGELPQARKLYEQAIEHQRLAYQTAPKHPTFSQFLRNHYSSLAEVLIQLGDHQAAAAAARELAKVRPKNADDAYLAATVAARCVSLAAKDSSFPAEKQNALARAYADQALALAAQALERGFKDPGRLEQEEAFAPLRAREEFQALLKKARPAPLINK